MILSSGGFPPSLDIFIDTLPPHMVGHRHHLWWDASSTCGGTLSIKTELFTLIESDEDVCQFAIDAVVANMLRQKLRANKDDLVGYRHRGLSVTTDRV